MKKYRVIIYAVIVILLVTVGAIASATTESGTFVDDNGKTYTYTYNMINKNLHIGGNGAINLYTSGDSAVLPWHQWRGEIKSVSVDKGILQIGRAMFKGCTAIDSLHLPGTVMYIQPEAFAGCTSLAQVSFDEGLLTLADRVFADCSSLTQIKLPSSVVGIGSEFISGTGVKEITLGNKLATLLPKKAGGAGATFAGAHKDLVVNSMQQTYGTQWLNNPELNIYNTAFVIYKPSGTFADKEGNADSLKWEVDIENRTLTICDVQGKGTANMPDFEEAKYASWFEYGKYYDTVVIASGVTRIGSRTFQSDSYVKTIYIPATVTAYGTYVFNGTGQLSNIVFEEGTTTLNYGLVINNNNSNLKELTIPKSVTKVHDNFFVNAQNKDRVKELAINVYRNTAGHEWAKNQKAKNDVIEIRFLD